MDKTGFDEINELLGVTDYVKKEKAKRVRGKRAKKKVKVKKDTPEPSGDEIVPVKRSKEEIEESLREAERMLKTGVSDVAVQAQLNQMGCNLIEIAGNIAMYGESQSVQLKAVQMLLDRILPAKKSVDSHVTGNVTLKVNVVKSWGDMEDVTEV